MRGRSLPALCLGSCLVYLILCLVPLARAGVLAAAAGISSRLRQEMERERKASAELERQQDELNACRESLTGIETQLAEAKAGAALLEAEAAQVEMEMGAVQTRLEARRKLVSRRVLALWRYGRFGYLAVLFQAGSLREFIARYELTGYILRHDRMQMEAYRREYRAWLAKGEDLRVCRAKLATQMQGIEALRADAEAQRRLAEARLLQVQAKYARILADRLRLEDALAEQAAVSAALGDEIRGQTEHAPLGTGKLIWPVAGRLSSGFGWRRHPVLGVRRFHTGQDIAVPSGTRVAAADNGIVRIVRWAGGYGFLVAIDHGRKLTTIYAHNGRLLVKEGELVVKGQIIATSDNTGLSTGPHLHFEVRLNGEPVNPLRYLPKKE